MKWKIYSILPFIGEYAVASVLCYGKEKFGMIDRSGAFVVHPKWDMISYSGGDLIAVSVGFYRSSDCSDDDNDGIWSIYSISGRSVTQTEYGDIDPWDDSLHFTAIDMEANRYGIVNIYGEIIAPFEYDFLGSPNSMGWIHAEKDGKNGCVNINGEVVIPLIYDELSPIFLMPDEAWLTVEKDGECFYIDQTNKRVLL